MTKQIYLIIGIHCASCKALIEKMVQKVEGVASVNVNFATEKMTVEFDETKTNTQEIAEAVAKAGSYRLVANEEGTPTLAPPKEAAELRETQKNTQSTKRCTSHHHTKAMITRHYSKNRSIKN